MSSSADRRPPDFFLIGAPKAGTTALHAALSQHPGINMSRVKEPKYYMCGDSPPPAYKGPGDAHSNQEWVWQRERYLDLFDDAPSDRLRGESTPFYLYNRDARRRIAADVPQARVIAVLRDPVDRAYSNWMHLWMDGLEPCADVLEAVRREPTRIDRGWAPFWHYQSLGMYGRQVADLYDHLPREQVLLVRYRELVDEPSLTLDRVFGFLGVGRAEIDTIPSDNSRRFVQDGPRVRAIAPVIRAGAALGQFLPPEVWRRISRPLVAQLHRNGTTSRPRLTPEQRATLLEPHLPDIELLERVTGESFADWKGYRDGGSFETRRSGDGAAVPRPRSAPGEAELTDGVERPALRG
ncbi:sulfotransferase family protein [Nocardioides insulae]|uniref:sulfotransferase family protein n=1 Tax=Nocardioides insulae TaxID=394734 RepID=UPI000A036718|nr:sulfotransferase [Nocardioides insulae]